MVPVLPAVERRGWSAEEVGLADVLSMRSIPSIPGLPCPVPEPRAGRAGGGLGSLAFSGLPGRLRSSPPATPAGVAIE